MSGGLDSTTLLRYLLDEGHNVHCLIVDYGQKHLKELAYAEVSCIRWGVKFTREALPELGGLTDESWVIDMRNWMLIGLASNRARRMGFDMVTLGCNRDDEAGFPDCRMAFFQLVNTTLTTIEIPVEVCTPFIDWPKWKIAAYAQQSGITLDSIWTCYRGGDKPCGNCPACLKLEAAKSAP